MNSNKILWVALVVVAIIAIGAYSFPKQTEKIAEVLGNKGTRFPSGVSVNTTVSPANNGFKVGQNGAEIQELISGFCTSFSGSGAASIDASQAASTTKPYDCAVTGVSAGDVVIAQLSTSTPVGTARDFWSIIGAKASTTAGFITVLLYNNGPAAVPSATGVGSSTAYHIFDITP